jgi:hypothetical protein
LKYCFRKLGYTVPALGLAQSYWALSQREVPIGQALADACSEGYDYFEVGLREERLDETTQLLKQFPLRLIAQGWASSAQEASIFFERAAQLHAVALNMHLGHAYMSIDESVDLVEEVRGQACAYGIPLLIETHRGRLTQDLFRASELVRRLPEIVITLDASHYIVAGETLGGSEDLFRLHLAPMLTRTALIHGRISNGQSVQISMDDSFAFTRVLRSLWQQAMELWLVDAPNDAVFVFEPELGPPPYAYVKGGIETFNRTAESRAIVRLAREAWEAALANANSIINR